MDKRILKERNAAAAITIRHSIRFLKAQVEYLKYQGVPKFQLDVADALVNHYENEMEMFLIHIDLDNFEI